MDRTKIYITWHHLLPGARLLVVQYSLQRPPCPSPPPPPSSRCAAPCDDDATFAPLGASAADQFAGHRTACQTSCCRHSPLTGSVGDSASGCRIHLISTKDLGNELAVLRLTRDLGNELARQTSEFPMAAELG